MLSVKTELNRMSSYPKRYNIFSNYFRLFLIVIITNYYAVTITIKMMLRGHKVCFQGVRRWTGLILKIVGVKLKVSGHEHIDKNETYVYAVNHSSQIDIPIIFSAINDDIRIMYKRELEKIPVFGYALKKSPFIAVSRGSKGGTASSIKEALKSIREGESLIIFPEGTRSDDGKLMEFKRGAFMLASKSGKKIIPVAIKGSANVLPKGSLRFSRLEEVEVIIKEPYDTAKIANKADEKELMSEVHKALLEELI